MINGSSDRQITDHGSISSSALLVFGLGSKAATLTREYLVLIIVRSTSISMKPLTSPDKARSTYAISSTQPTGIHQLPSSTLPTRHGVHQSHHVLPPSSSTSSPADRRL